MSIAQDNEPILRKPLRLCPVVPLAVLLLLDRYVVPVLAAGARPFGVPIGIISVLGALFCGVAVVVWWVFVSRAAWSERLGALVVIIVGLFATSRIVHPSVA